MSTETTKKKIKIDNGTNYAYAYTDKAIDAKMPTDINVDANGFAILCHDGAEITGQRKTIKLADVRENGAVIGRDQTTSAPQIDELITKEYADKEYGAPISVESNAEDLPVTITLTDEQSAAIENQIANGHFNVNVTLSSTGQKFLFNQAVALAEGGVLYYAMAMISFSLFTATTIVMTYSKIEKTLTLSQQEPLFKNETSLRVIDNKVSLYSGDNDTGAPFGKSYSIAKINGNSILNDPDTVPVQPSYYAPETINTTATAKVLTSKSGAFEWSDIPKGGEIEVIEGTITSTQGNQNEFTISVVPKGKIFILKMFLGNILMSMADSTTYTGFCYAGNGSFGVILDVSTKSGGIIAINTAYWMNADSTQNGKVLSIVDGAPSWSDPPRYEHTITIKNSAGKILWTQTMRNSSNTVVNSYTSLKTLFGEATYAGFGEYCQLNLHGGTEETDKLIKTDGTEVTLASLGAIVYTDDCFLSK